MINNTNVAAEPAVSGNAVLSQSFEEMSSGSLVNSQVYDSGGLAEALLMSAPNGAPHSDGWLATRHPEDPAPRKLLGFLIDMFIIAKSPVELDGSHGFPRPPKKS